MPTPGVPPLRRHCRRRGHHGVGCMLSPWPGVGPGSSDSRNSTSPTATAPAPASRECSGCPTANIRITSPLLKSSFSLWRELEGRKRPEGVLRHRRPVPGAGRRKELVGGALGSARKFSLPFELLDRAALRKRFPQFNVPENFSGMLEENAGFILPGKSHRHPRPARHAARGRGFTDRRASPAGRPTRPGSR